jgi:hypothetical protein
MDTQALENLGQGFTRWRAERGSRRERIPESLLEEARKLASSVSEQEISRRTGIARSRLFPVQQKVAKFVELPAQATLPQVGAIQIEFKNRDTTIAISAPLTVNLESLLSALRRP